MFTADGVGGQLWPAVSCAVFLAIRRTSLQAIETSNVTSPTPALFFSPRMLPGGILVLFGWKITGLCYIQGHGDDAGNRFHLDIFFR